MIKGLHSIKLSVIAVCVFALGLCLCACGASGTSSQSSNASAASGASMSSQAQESSSASSSAASSTGTGWKGFNLFGSDEDDDYVTVKQKYVYWEGIHHAELVFQGYEDRPLEIEIYAHSAPETAKRFCTLVDLGYYNGRPVFWILNEMYMRVGNPEQEDMNLITGEYEESDVSNSNSLKRGVMALNRAADGQQSDASSFFICMSDLSYLDNKYAAFAKITKNYEVVEEISQRVTSSDPQTRIDIEEKGRVIDVAKAPHIVSIEMID